MKNLAESEILEMINDTNQLIKKDKISMFMSISQACNQSNDLTNEVEFWKWMGANYKNNFGTIQSIQESANLKSVWVKNQLQGKGYEWDFMSKQRSMLKNILSRFEAGDCPTQPGTDINRICLFNNSVENTYQNKAYTTKTNNPDLGNTPNNAIVVTNKEKVSFAKSKGYDTIEFMDANKINHNRDKRFEKAQNGTVNNTYNIKNISSSMVKAGTMGCVIGITTESIASFKKWKNGEISNREYLNEIAKAGGDAGVTGSITSGIMIPISASITSMGVSTIITIPIAYVVGGAVNKVVAPCFARGKYKEILNNAKYYQNLEYAYNDLMNSIENSAKEYEKYILNVKNQANKNKELDLINEQLENVSREIDKKLKDLYDSI